MPIQRRTLLTWGTASSIACLHPQLHAQTFPDRTLTLVVPFPPGGNNDVVARTIAEPLSKALGQTVIVENRAGGGGAVGTTYVAGAKPDGLTLLVAPPGQIATLPHMIKAGYKLDSFKPVGFANRTSMVLVARKKDTRFKSLEEFIKLARSRPGTLNVGHGGPGTPNHLAVLQLEEAANCSFGIISYRGSAPMLQDLLGGQIDAVMDQVTSSKPHFDAGTLYPLAVLGTSPDAGMPNVPTLGQIGLKEFDSTTYVGLLAPSGTPDANIAILSAALKKAVENPAVMATFSKFGSAAYAGDVKEFRANLSREDALAADLVKAGKLKAE